MNKEIIDFVLFIVTGTIVIFLFKLTPLSQWSQGWFSGVVTFSIYYNLIKPRNV